MAEDRRARVLRHALILGRARAPTRTLRRKRGEGGERHPRTRRKSGLWNRQSRFSGHAHTVPAFRIRSTDLTYERWQRREPAPFDRNALQRHCSVRTLLLASGLLNLAGNCFAIPSASMSANINMWAW